MGDRESMLIDIEYDSSSVVPGAAGKIRIIFLNMVDGRVRWGIGCGGVAPVSAKKLEICDAVVRSFRILR